MSRHEGVSCDSCLKGNFRGRRYKCLICYDYDLCATCYEAGATTTRHTSDHAMQCILTRTDFDLFYGGETVTVESPQSYSCPFCGKMGYTESLLQDHVTSTHVDTTSEVICPVCASLPGGDPNHVTEDFAAHLTLEHRATRDLDEPTGIRHIRRGHAVRGGLTNSRARRTNMPFSTADRTLTSVSLAMGGRETMDPISDLLLQLSASRRAVLSGTPQQINELQRQLQDDHHFGLSSLRIVRPGQQLERLPTRRLESRSQGTTSQGSANTSNPDILATAMNTNLPTITANHAATNVASNKPQFLLTRYSENTLSEAEKEDEEIECADQSLFVQELLLSTLTEQLHLDAKLDDVDNSSLTDTASQSVTMDTVSDLNMEENSIGNKTDSSANSNSSDSTATSQVEETLRTLLSKHLEDNSDKEPPPE